MPALVVVPLSTGNDMTIAVVGGPLVAWRLGYAEVDNDFTEPNGARLFIRRQDVGFAVGVSVERRQLVVDIRYNVGLTDINHLDTKASTSSNPNGDDPNEIQMKRRSLALTVGWLFK